MMKYFARFLVLFLLFASSAAAQGFRWDAQITQQATVAGVTNVVTIPAAAQVAFCNFPANATPCTNKATTYTSQTLVTPCSTSTQIVLTGTTSCVASPDAQENWGVWVPAGMYAYTITLPGGVNLGPYVVTLFPLSTNYAFTGNNTHSGIETFTGAAYFAAGPVCDVKAYGAKGDFVNDDTAAINSAITACAAVNGTTYFSRGTYRIVPATAQTNDAGPATIAFNIVSNMHLLGELGAILKLADNQSTDASPKRLYMFSGITTVSNLSWYGLTMDMNFANNKISPARPATYNLYQFAPISLSGTNANGTDVSIEYCKFLNTPGTSYIVAGQSNTNGIVLGSRWIIAHNTFIDGGMDASDFSAIYGWANNMQVHDNLFLESVPYGTVGKTGAVRFHEVHGSNHDVHDNFAFNYFGGVVAGMNYTSITVNTNIHDNQMVVTYSGVNIDNASRSGGTSAGLSDVKVHDNIIQFIEQTYSGSPSSQVGIDAEMQLPTNNIEISNNHFVKTGTNTVGSIGVVVAPNVAGQQFNNVRVNDNSMIGLAHGIHFFTTTAGLGYTEADGNEFVNMEGKGGVTNGAGIFVDATNTIKTLSISNNRFIDERGGSATFTYGILFQNGTVTDLYMGPQTYKGMVSANYWEISGAITNRRGMGLAFGAPVTWGPNNSATIADTGLSRDAAGVVDVGNGTQGDVTGTMKYKASQFVETAAPSGVAGSDLCYGDSTAHAIKCSNNNGTFSQMDLTSNTTTTTTQVLHASATAGIGTYAAIATADEPSSVVQNNQVNTGGASMTLNMTSSGAITPSQTNGIIGTTTNNNANAGAVGEYVQSVLATGSSVTLATGVTSNVTSISLTAGDWDVTGAVDFTFGATTSYTNLIGSVSTTTGTIGGQDSKFDFETPAAVPTAAADATFPLPVVRFSLSGTTTVFLVAQGTFTVSTLKAYGTIRARRVR